MVRVRPKECHLLKIDSHFLIVALSVGHAHLRCRPLVKCCSAVKEEVNTGSVHFVLRNCFEANGQFDQIVSDRAVIVFEVMLWWR